MNLNRKSKNLIFLLVTFLLLPDLSLAAPNVSSVTGNISDGETINISGSSFGSAPNVRIFDDFESGTPGADIATGAGSAKYGQWDSRDAGGSSFYGTTAKLSGSQSFTTDYSVHYANWIEARLPLNTRNVFVSWWLHIPAGNNWPGEGTTDGDNWKQMWLQGISTNDDDLVLPTRLESNWVLAGNDRASCRPPFCTDGYTKYVDVSMQKGEWKRLWVYLKGSTGTNAQDGESKLWELTELGVSNLLNDLTASNLKTDGTWDRVRPNGFGRKTPNCVSSFDDIYIASGPNAQARVEIGNASTYANSTKLTILTPTSWGENSISAQVNVGNFSPESAYLYVFDASGVSNENGYPITIGAGSVDTTAPNAPTGLGVI